MTGEWNRCVIGDCRAVLPTLPADTFACCVTSPPYWGLRDYGAAGQIGLESSPDEYVAEMVQVFAEVRRVLRDDGTLWLNLGDSYIGAQGGWQGKNGDRASRTFTARIELPKKGPGLKPKDLVGIPWRVAFALQADGWYLRSDIVWHKPNPMPESVADRPTKSHEYVFLLSKSERYHFDGNAIREPLAAKTRTAYGTKPKARCHDRYVKASNWARSVNERKPKLNGDGSEAGANVRTVWTIGSQPYDGAHFATFPPRLAERCILAGAPLGGAVLDPFFGSGTVGQVAEQLGRQWFGVELNPEYGKLIAARTAQAGLAFGGTAP